MTVRAEQVLPSDIIKLISNNIVFWGAIAQAGCVEISSNETRLRHPCVFGNLHPGLIESINTIIHCHEWQGFNTKGELPCTIWQ
ncbi:hypothetical protein [Aliiroseovarius sp. 2305UL8-7]|uniref:hypothetical protein n=1 Tax=Aliiroseovarius conchicola TaxID=3121637 RepID=UPI003529152F